MSRAWTNDAMGGMFAGLLVGSTVLLLKGAGLPNELVFAIPGAAVGMIGWVWWAVARANRKRTPDGSLTSGEVEALRLRMDDLDQLQARIAELEERMEFSERLLARQDHDRALPQ